MNSQLPSAVQAVATDSSLTDSPDAALSALSDTLASAAVSWVKEDPQDFSGHMQKLADLRLEVAKKSAEIVAGDETLSAHREEFVWQLAQDLPPFDTAALYQKRASHWAILAAVILGWVCGGILATLLNIVGLGGEIIRPLCIVLFIWAEEYLCVSPRARRLALGVLGFAGLARFAATAVNGFFRFTSFGALRTAIFGAGARPGLFRTGWLFLGAFLVMIFLSRRISGLDTKAFEASMRIQILDRFKLCILILSALKSGDQELFECQKKLNAADPAGVGCNADCGLAAAVVDLLPAFTPDQRALLKARLAAQGFSTPGASNEANFLVWNEGKYGQEYEPIGQVEDGDTCLVLREPLRTPTGIIRGNVQKFGGRAPIPPERTSPRKARD